MKLLLILHVCILVTSSPDLSDYVHLHFHFEDFIDDGSAPGGLTFLFRLYRIHLRLSWTIIILLHVTLVFDDSQLNANKGSNHQIKYTQLEYPDMTYSLVLLGSQWKPFQPRVGRGLDPAGELTNIAKLFKNR